MTRSRASEVPTTSLYLGQRMYGAPDQLRTPVRSMLARPREITDVDVMSQQVADEALVDRLCEIGRRGGTVRVFVEKDYVDRTTATNAQDLRSMDQLRHAGIAVRTDSSSHLEHGNVLLVRRRDSVATLVTSANLTTSEIDEDYNSAVIDRSRTVHAALSADFGRLWAGGDKPRRHVGRGTPRIATTFTGDVSETLARAAAAARTSLRFAVFAFSVGSRLTAVLTEAAGRGVAVRGVVDGDQVGQPWDAVRTLRRHRVDARYVPGRLTGGQCRMHHKMLLIDDAVFWFGTYNFSADAVGNYEIMYRLNRRTSRTSIVRASAELDRLHAAAVVHLVPPPH